MEFGLISFSSGLIQKQAAQQIIKCNDFTKNFGLRLTAEQAAELVETRSLSLSANGRIEFGGGVIDKIIREFCDSPYLRAANYAQTLHELIEIFYYYKNETLDLISDDDLIKFMKTAYDGVCAGSLELLSHKELYQLARELRFGAAFDSVENNLDDEDDDFYE